MAAKQWLTDLWDSLVGEQKRRQLDLGEVIAELGEEGYVTVEGDCVD